MIHENTVTVHKGQAQGTVRVPTSKSIAHRALICAALAPDGSSCVISDVPKNEDIDATLDCLAALGVPLQIEQEPSDQNCRRVTVGGCGGRWQKGSALHCRESGSTLRFMLPLCMLNSSERQFTGSTRLLQRPLDDYRTLLEHREWRQDELTLNIGSGAPMSAGTYRLAGKSSSQFITGLLFVLPLLDGDSAIELECAPESRSYIDMTLTVMSKFGVRATWESDTRICVPGRQAYRAINMTVDGDASGAAFFHALSAIGAPVEVSNAPKSDILQGDSICVDYLQKMVKNGRELPIFSLADCPDLGPILFAAATLCHGAVFTHTARLRLKESDRVAAMASELRKFGASIVTSDDILTNEIKAALPTELQALGDGTACGGWVAVLPSSHGLHAPIEQLNGHNDHRIVMSLSILCSLIGDGRITDAHAVRKSFPSFFDCMRSLGIAVEGDR